MAAAGHSMRRGHHRICADDRRSVSHHPSWPAMAVLLADSLSERKTDLAQPALAPGVGFLRHLDVPDRQHALPAPADYSRLRTHAGSDDRLAAQSLWRAGVGLARNKEAVASVGSRHASDGDCNCAGRRIGAHHCVVRLLHVSGPDVALDGLWSLL